MDVPRTDAEPSSPISPPSDSPVPAGSSATDSRPQQQPTSRPRSTARWWPITLIVVGALLIFPGSLAVWFVGFVMGLGSLNVPDMAQAGGDIANGGSIELAEGQEYMLWPFDAQSAEADFSATAACTVQGPDGSDVPVTMEDGGPGTVPAPMVTPVETGEHTVTCTGLEAAADPMISVYPSFSESTGAATAPLIAAIIVGVLGLALLITGIVLLRRANRARSAEAAAAEAEMARVLQQPWIAGDPDGEPGDTDFVGTANTTGPAGAAGTAGVARTPGTSPFAAPGHVPAPSDDERVVLSPENAFGTQRGSGRSTSMVPAVVAIVVGALLMVGGPVGGVLAPIIGYLADPAGKMQGGSTSNGDSIDLPANNIVSVYAAESEAFLPQTDEEWENYTPPPIPHCTVTDPSGDVVELQVESQGGYESGTMTTNEAGPYTFTCELDSRYAGTIDAYAMGDAEGGGMSTAMVIGLALGVIGLILLVCGIVLAVRTSARRQDGGL